MSIRFDCKTIHGDPIEVATPTTDACVAILKNPEATRAQRELATQVLDWVERRMVSAGTNPLDRAAVRCIVEMEAGDLWAGTKIVKIGPDGVGLTMIPAA
ncbi:MAG TPA: hypothetical protein VFF64_24420 [Candidatus Eremiobacteraceae bacterium]|nr:hypothetical protein [Candidatus Eremiobacteraceae bacterium]